MNSVLTQVSAVAIWGSLLATVVLGAFLGVQALLDPERRTRFAFLAAVCWYLAALDFLRSLGHVPPALYEQLRLLWAGTYAAGVLRLFGYPRRWAIGVAFFLPAVGTAVFRFVNPDIATTVTIPLVFGIAGGVHIHQYLRKNGYASALLGAYMIALAMMCALYYQVISTKDPAIMWLGYAHYAEASIVSVFLGWVHLPRELLGRSPVTMPVSQARGLFVAVVGSELLLQLGLLVFWGTPPVLYLIAQTLQLVFTVAYYLRHRHQLVIYAANVGQLLDERTAELRKAQAEVARQNESLAQRLAEQARDLEAKNTVIDRQRRLELAAQTAGQVAHDIQNLISPILDRTLSLEDARSLSDIREIGSTIRRQVNQLLELNTQLLALSRRGRVELHPVDLTELARDIATRFPEQRLVIESKGVVWVNGSWSQLSRTISNLVTNALESDLDRLVPVTLRLGTTEITQNRRCHLGFLGPGRHAYAEVEDQGPGIPEDHVDKIFEPFFSLKRGKHRSGSGLGLTIVAAVVDDHKGVIDLETSGKGTRFTLYFPAIDPPVAASELGKLSCHATVLVVDDDRSILKDYGQLLEEAGYTVIAAESGAQAIRVLQAQEVDLVLLDLSMPRMNGLETFLGAMHVRPGIRAVVHSSYVAEDQAVKLKGLGVSTVLLKPAGRLDLLRALRHAFDEKKASEEERRNNRR
jgi:signal transduction histidine kinase/ActR/RegA family two-component response regulator